MDDWMNESGCGWWVDKLLYARLHSVVWSWEAKLQHKRKKQALRAKIHETKTTCETNWTYSSVCNWTTFMELQ